jgi:MoxR-like ATPase
MTTHSIPNAAPHNFPIQVTSFIGREREIAEVTRLLATSHLLTLTGAGGCGKTRLALQVAAQAAGEVPLEQMTLIQSPIPRDLNTSRMQSSA